MSCWPAGASRAAGAACPVPAALPALAAPAPAAGSAAPAAAPLAWAWAAAAPGTAAPGTAAPGTAAAGAELDDPPDEQPASAAMARTISPGAQAAPGRRRGATMCL